ncbi:hypothetical protein [Paenarthrobacter sp. A20]|uniref:hypothetical protein n=1 Tax=Paenarthrobacter sp. A20 TaxID=2817891 RepID=UPI00209D0AD2|nr:hypothetical protein [Paenarthrobacter sp. A20]MCP1415493.1 hypothetical protein [Paenarthrobacter sp. A20]
MVLDDNPAPEVAQGSSVQICSHEPAGLFRGGSALYQDGRLIKHHDFGIGCARQSQKAHGIARFVSVNSAAVHVRAP